VQFHRRSGGALRVSAVVFRRRLIAAAAEPKHLIGQPEAWHTDILTYRGNVEGVFLFILGR
jgi:hypothetical protein